MLKYLLILFLVALCFEMHAQADTISVEPTAVKSTEPDPLFSGNPGKAALFSLILPGAGQFYNKRYWKVPIATGAVVGMGLLLSQTSQDHKRFKEAYIAEIRGETHEFSGFFTQGQLRRLREERRKAQQSTAVFFGVVWLLNSVDAYVDGHLRTFDTSEDLSFAIKSLTYPDIAYQGVGIQLSF